MAILKYTWNAPLVAQVDTLTPGGTIVVGNTFTVTINTKAITYVATGTTVASVTAGLYALLAACQYPEFLEITWADAGTAITATSTQKGRQFDLSVSKAQGVGVSNTHTFGRTATTANSGPEDALCTANYSSGALPANNDTIVLENSNQNILYNIGALSFSGIKLFGRPTYTGNVGLPEYNPAGYDEYRATYLELGFTQIEWEAPSQRVKLSVSGASADTVAYVKNTGQPLESGIPAFLIKGGSSSDEITLSATKGSVGAALFPNESCYLAPSTFGSHGANDVDVILGPGVVFDGNQYSVSGGSVVSNTSLTNLYVYGGRVTIAKGAIGGTIENRGGTVIYASTSTPLAKYIGYAGTTLDLRQVLSALVITAGELYPTAAILGGENFVTFGSLKIFGGAINSVSLPAWKNIAVAVSAL